MAIKKQVKNDPLFVKIKSQLNMEVHEAVGADGYYRYYVGGFSTREEATAVSKKINTIANIVSMVKPSTAF